ncbi:hypothetical protein L6452_18500 [Arctium lappa]|uniref:Uncharacterized protein n=1 Tax=Arctium lappa TaxID=4217 RepID=A0ACB9C6C7_ARCLA|nr:hypothetical protein L6452_18500 [Arctium lappa]
MQHKEETVNGVVNMETKDEVVKKRITRKKTMSKRKKKGSEKHQEEANVEHQDEPNMEEQEEPFGDEKENLRRPQEKRKKLSKEEPVRLMRLNHKPTPSTSIESLKSELLKALDKHTAALKKSLTKKTKNIMNKVEKLQGVVALMKNERMQEAKHKEKKELVIRDAWKKGK